MLLSKVLGFSLLAASAVHAFGSYRDYDEIALRDALDIVAEHYDLTAREVDYFEELFARAVSKADISKAESDLRAQMNKCDSIKRERDNVTPGPAQKQKKDKLARDLDACKNAYMQMKTRLDRLRDEYARQKK
ncbi:hypothetical protein BKA70DRAFT_1277474 [Coprinopsis sp. MPI-PUGE-AT-0042]|nr:hypothetical protein BKA70DRAFT_1277474 [Coprinopsis sp. MPI-PUGE-AT-0042]